MKFLVVGIISAMLAVGSTAMAKEQVFQADVKKSIVNWTGSKVVGSEHTGTVDVKSGNVVFKDSEPLKAEIVIDMSTIVDKDLTDPEWNNKLVTHLKSADFFDVTKHKESKLVVTEFKKTEKSQYQLKGDLTIKGKTKPVSFKASETETKEGRRISADLTFDRTDFDVRYGSGKFFDNLGDKMISDDVSLKVTIQLENTARKTAAN